MRSGGPLPSLEYGLAVVVLAVPMLLMGMTFVNLIDLVFSSPITKLSAVTLGG